MIRLSARLLATVILFACVSPSLTVQAKDDGSNSGIPLVPINVRFQYVPLYLAQSITNNLRYERIEALINQETEEPWYEVILTDKTTGRRISYLNSIAAVNVLRHQGSIAHYASIEFRNIKESDSHPNYQIAFHDSYGQLIFWKFVVNSRLADAGTRFTPALGTAGFLMMHASSRFSAAKGTVLRIGKGTYPAELSDAGSRVSYDGFSALGLVSAEIVPGTSLWMLDSEPEQIAPGTKWVLHSPAEERTFLVEQADPEQLQIRQLDQPNPFSPPAELDVVRQGHVLSLRSLSFFLSGHVLQIFFEPPAAFPVKLLEDNTASDFVMREDGELIAKGSISVQRALDTEHVQWSFSFPNWAKSNSFDSGVNLLP